MKSQRAVEPNNVVILGAGLGGLRTAEQLRQLGYTGRTTLVGAEEHLPYDRPPLTKGFLRGAVETTELRKEYDSICDDLRLGTSATGVDTGSRLVELSDGSSLTYDALVLALGAEPRRLPESAGGAFAHVVRTIDDAEGLRRSLLSGGPVVVIGGGFVGCEVAASARALDCTVTLVEADASGPLARALGSAAAAVVTETLRRHGVEIRAGAGVVEIVGRTVLLDDGSVLQADTVVAGLGAHPTLEWLAPSGVDLAGGIVCNAGGETSIQDVYAVGDAASWEHPLAPDSRRTEHWTSAVDQARTVAANILRTPSDPLVVNSAIPYFWCDIADMKIQVVGFIDPAHDVVPAPGFEGRVLLYAAQGRLTGAVTFSLPRVLVGLRKLVQYESLLSDALISLSTVQDVSAN